MIHEYLINPKSIVVIGGTDNLSSPGGRVLKNLTDYNFKGDMYVVNPKKENVQNITTYKSVDDLPNVDLAIIAIASKFVEETVKVLTQKKNTKGFIILSAGFSEKDIEGAQMESKITKMIDAVNGSLLGPNNIGLINTNYAGVFTIPIPKLDNNGVDLISGSGATAVFIIEASKSLGLTFSSVYTLGNSAQIGIEEVLEYLDYTFNESSSKTKLLYVESIKNPKKFLKHARSLAFKGCKIAAIKSGSSEAGNRAASSHTGAMASPDTFVNALFEKAGIIRCYSKSELIYVAGILQQKELKGNRVIIVTHAGGPAVMLTDELSKNGLQVPEIAINHQEEILKELFNGSSAANPIDFLATGTAEQLDFILDYCEQNIDTIDAIVVIFGSPGLTSVKDAYQVISNHIKKDIKPIYTVLPSVINAESEIQEFISLNNIAFVDEVLFGNALSKVNHTLKPESKDDSIQLKYQKEIRQIIDNASNGYLEPEATCKLLEYSDIKVVKQLEVTTENELNDSISLLDFPVVMKVVGPIHKSDVGGVILNVQDDKNLMLNFKTLMQIKDAKSVLIQPMLKGLEVFVGAKAEPSFPHLVMCGLGGIYIEAIKDVRSCLSPVTPNESQNMIKQLKSYTILQGTRGKKGINLKAFEDTILKVSGLLQIAPEIVELDLNPLIANVNDLIAVDARLRIFK